MSFLQNANNTTIHGGTFTLYSNTESNDWSNEQPVIQELERHVALGAFHNSKDRYDPPKCLNRTRVAVFRDLSRWIRVVSPSQPMLWLYGPAGAGKSAIAQSLTEKCDEIGYYLAATFFFSTSDGQRNTTARLVPSIAFQLISSIPATRPFILRAISSNPQIFSVNLKTQLQKLVIEPLHACGVDRATENKPMLVIIDGLDECIESRERIEFLQALFQIYAGLSFPLILLCASRPESDIRSAFNHNDPQFLCDRLILDNHFQPDKDIHYFIWHCLAEVKRTHPLREYLPSDWPPIAAIYRLVRKSSGQFIYASTVLKYITSRKHRPHKRLDIILNLGTDSEASPFAELDALYKHVLSNTEDHDKLMRVLGIILFTEWNITQVTPVYVDWMASLEEGDTLLLLDNLHSLFDIGGPGGRITPSHASLRDFLSDRSRACIYYLDPQVAFADLALGTLKAYLEKYTHKFTPGELNPGFSPLEYTGVYLPHAYPTDRLRQYLASVEWDQIFERLIWYAAAPQYSLQKQGENGWAPYIGEVFGFCELMSEKSTLWKQIHEQQVSKFTKWFLIKYHKAKRRYPNMTKTWAMRFYLEQLLPLHRQQLSSCADYPVFLVYTDYFDETIFNILKNMLKFDIPTLDRHGSNCAVLHELHSLLRGDVEDDPGEGLVIHVNVGSNIVLSEGQKRLRARKKAQELLDVACRSCEIDELLPPLETLMLDPAYRPSNVDGLVPGGKEEYVRHKEEKASIVELKTAIERYRKRSVEPMDGAADLNKGSRTSRIKTRGELFEAGGHFTILFKKSKVNP